MNTLPNVWRARSPENRQPLGLDDLKDVDETMAQHLEWLLDNQVGCRAHQYLHFHSLSHTCSSHVF